MKKQILAFMACAAFLAPTSGFCMESDQSEPTTKNFTLKVLYEPRFNVSPDTTESVALSYKYGKGTGCLGHYQSLTQYTPQSREVSLFGEGDTVEFFYTSTLKKMRSLPETQTFDGEFYKQDQGEEISFDSRIPVSSITDGSSVTLRLKAHIASRRALPSGGYSAPYIIDGRVLIK